MEYFHPYIEEGKEQAYESPFIRVAHELGEFVLDHLNSRVRIFPELLREYNHVEFLTPDDNLIGIEADQRLLDYLVENDYPYLYLPFVDVRTREWWERCQANKMYKELGELGLEGL